MIQISKKYVIIHGSIFHNIIINIDYYSEEYMPLSLPSDILTQN